MITVLIYLSTPTEGGETVFPNAEVKSTGGDWSQCAQQGLANKPVKGDALMFYRWACARAVWVALEAVSVWT